MNREGISALDSNKKHARHIAAVARKYETLGGKQALLDFWESQPDEVLIREHDYIVGLRARVRSLKVGFAAMRPSKDFV